MITSMQIYWLLMATNVKVLFTVAGIVLIMISFMMIPAGLEMFIGKDTKSNKLYWITTLIVFLVSLVIIVVATFIPTTKQLAVILVAPKVINNEQVQKLPNQVLELANEWLEELKPKGVEVK